MTYLDNQCKIIKLKQQIENLFSNKNLEKDVYLNNRITKTPEGFIPLTIIISKLYLSSFENELKNYSNLQESVLEAIKVSKILEFNTDKTEVRRIDENGTIFKVPLMSDVIGQTNQADNDFLNKKRNMEFKFDNAMTNNVNVNIYGDDFDYNSNVKMNICPNIYGNNPVSRGNCIECGKVLFGLNKWKVKCLNCWKNIPYGKFQNTINGTSNYPYKSFKKRKYY